MNNRLYKYITTFLLIVSCSAAVQLYGQNITATVNKGVKDSLVLSQIIKVVLDFPCSQIEI